MIEVSELSKSFGAHKVLDRVSLSIAPGEIFFLIGSSGAGKSVLIKQIIGLLAPDHGSIRVDGEEVVGLSEEQLMPIRKRCALVLQHATLFDSMSCEENVALPLRYHLGLSREEARTRAKNLLAITQTEGFADSYPASLGDGLRKRVAVSRALGLSPAHMLFDEPTTSLDPVSARSIDQLIYQLAREQKVTCVVVSHDLESIFSIADRVGFLYQGKLRALGTVAELRENPDPVLQQFLSGSPDGPMETT